MPIFIPPDTARALGNGLTRCESRSLFKDKFNLFDQRFDEDKQVSLDFFLSHGRSDVDSLRQTWEATIARQKRNQREDRNVNQRDLDKANAALVSTEHFDCRPQGAPQPVNLGRHWLKDLPKSRVRIFHLETTSRLLVGLANGTLENAGCSLHPRYGFPIIPGSALKGVARDAAAALQFPTLEITNVFGNSPDELDARQGGVCFLDAFSILEVNQMDLEMDILTPHYQKYYGRSGNPNALDEEAPIPNVFPAVCRGVAFEFALVVSSSREEEVQAAALLDQAEKALKHGLINHGIGAKTAAGYGHFRECGNSVFESSNDLFPLPPKPILPVAEEFSLNWRGQTGNQFRFRALIRDLKAVEPELLARIFDENMPAEHLANFRTANPYWQAFVRDGGKCILERLNRPLP